MTVDRLKKLIREINQLKQIPHENLYQNYFFERFLVRLAKSKYRNRFILKGGYLLSAIFGLEERVTADIDLTIHDFNVTEESLTTAIKEIIAVPVEDETTFNITNTHEIRDEDKYTGMRFTLQAQFHSMKIYIKIDFSTGDPITPRMVERPLHLSLSDSDIVLYSYNIETILAEKIETILSRADANTRMKDYFDIYTIMTKDFSRINQKTLKKAINKTFNHRGSLEILDQSTSIMKQLEDNENMQLQWEKYRQEHNFVGQTSYADVMRRIYDLVKLIN